MKAMKALMDNTATSDEIIWHGEHYTGRGAMKFYPSGKDLAIDMNICIDTLVATHNVHFEFVFFSLHVHSPRSVAFRCINVCLSKAVWDEIIWHCEQYAGRGV